MRRILIAILSVILIGCGSLEQTSPTVRPTIVLPTPTIPAATGAESGGLPQIPADDPRSMGDPNAPVTIIEYSDFECPFCLRYVDETYSQIKANHVETGQVRYVFRNFIAASSHLAAPSAAVASLCAADQGEFWPMHDMLFAHSAEWWGQVETAEATFAGYADELGLDTVAFATCQADPSKLAQVQSETQAASALGLNGTPAFLVNQYAVIGAQPYDNFVQAIEAAQSPSQ